LIYDEIEDVSRFLEDKMVNALTKLALEVNMKHDENAILVQFHLSLSHILGE
jgi:hypothetical protein